MTTPTRTYYTCHGPGGSCGIKHRTVDSAMKHRAGHDGRRVWRVATFVGAPAVNHVQSQTDPARFIRVPQGHPMAPAPLGKPVEHGTHFAYNTHKCRCTKCRENRRTWMAEHRAEARASEGAPHPGEQETP